MHYIVSEEIPSPLTTLLGLSTDSDPRFIYNIVPCLLFLAPIIVKNRS